MSLDGDTKKVALSDFTVGRNDMRRCLEKLGVWPPPKGTAFRKWLADDDTEDSPYTLEEWRKLFREKMGCD